MGPKILTTVRNFMLLWPYLGTGLKIGLSPTTSVPYYFRGTLQFAFQRVAIVIGCRLSVVRDARVTKQPQSRITRFTLQSIYRISAVSAIILKTKFKRGPLNRGAITAVGWFSTSRSYISETV